MAGWMHFIDKREYYVSRFIREAESVGVARPVSLTTLEEMQWADRVCLLQVGGAVGVKSPVMFAEFPIERLAGLSAEAVDRLAREFPCRLYDLGGDKIRRGQLDFHTGFTYQIDAALGDVARELMKMEEAELGSPMIACFPNSIKPVDKPFPLFRNLEYQTGYRRFDVEDVWKQIMAEQRGGIRRRAHITGQCLPEPPYGDLAELRPFAGDMESATVLDAPLPVYASE